MRVVLPSEQMDETRKSLRCALQALWDTSGLAEAEAVLDDVSAILGLNWPCWVPDTSRPYYCPEMDAFARSRGWPGDLLDLWWSKNAALKMPVYIRCRFEHMPFVTSVDGKNRRGTKVSPEQTRIAETLKGMGINRMLAVPLHLPKGQVAALIWAGDRGAEELNAALPAVAGDLLGIGHRFMDIAQQAGVSTAYNERCHLTPREWDCLRTLAQGYREAEVAELTGISKVTVRFHLDNVVIKLGCRTRTQAVALAAQLGLLGPIGS